MEQQIDNQIGRPSQTRGPKGGAEGELGREDPEAVEQAGERDETRGKGGERECPADKKAKRRRELSALNRPAERLRVTSPDKLVSQGEN